MDFGSLANQTLMKAIDKDTAVTLTFDDGMFTTL